MANGVAARAGHPADRYRPGTDHLSDRRPGAFVDLDRRRAGAHRAGGGDSHGVGTVRVTGHPAWSAVVLGICVAAFVLAVIANFGWAA